MLERLKIGALAGLLAIAVVGMSGFAAVSAQDATPTGDGTPMAAECVSPGLPPGTPTPMEEGMEGMDMASPEAGMDVASPEAGASPEAMPMPEAPPLPEGQPADEATAAEIDAALTNYVACLNQGTAAGDPALYVALESGNFIMESTGTGNPYDRVASEMEGGIGAVTLLGISNQMTYEDGRVSGDVALVIGDHWATTIRVLLVQEGDTWLWDEEHFLPADTSDAESISVVGVAISETTDESTGEVTYAFTFTGGSTTFTQVEALVFSVDNTTAVELHEAVVLQLPEGADPMGIFDGSVAFEDVEFIGAVAPIFPGEIKELALVNLEPGIYTMVCFFPGPDGAPHAMNGMIAQFEIVAPAE
ncbi:hypothetical protein BH23CHL4_BH23CHL4_29820 [soil metagenome]